MYVCCVLCMVGCVFFCIRDELPLSKDPPLEFATLPEFYLDDLVELLLFLSQCVYGTPAIVLSQH